MQTIELEAIKAAGWRPLERGEVEAFSEEYTRRLHAREPVREPRFVPGDWVFCGLQRANVRVVSVQWDRGMPNGAGGCLPFWRVNVPGVSARDTDFSSPRADAPYRYHVQVAVDVWARAVPRRLAGRCADGAERGAGRKFHALREDRHSDVAACGARPGRLSAGWSVELGESITCPRCASKVGANEREAKA